MVQSVKVLATKPKNLRVPRTHMGKRKNLLSQVVF